MCGRQGLPRRGCWSKRYATRACRSSEKSAASEGVELADMHDVMTSCAHITRLERSDAACDRMPQSLRHSECQVGGRSGDDVGGATRSFEGCQPLFLATEHEGVVELLVFSECRVDLLSFRRPVRSHAISLQG